jgi:hypothetical protein
MGNLKLGCLSQVAAEAGQPKKLSGESWIYLKNYFSIPYSRSLILPNLTTAVERI